MHLTPEDERNGRTADRCYRRLNSAIYDVEQAEEYLRRVTVEKRKPGWEAAYAALVEKRDEAQADLDAVHRRFRANPCFSTSVLLEVMKARLKHSGTLSWVTTVESLGGPQARTVLARIRGIERNGHGTMNAECPVVQAMMLQDENPEPFEPERKRRAGGDAGRGLERDTGAGT